MQGRSSPRAWLRVVLPVLLIAASYPARAADRRASSITPWAVLDPGQGPVQLPDEPPGLSELSGLSYLGDDRYFAVSDDGGRLFLLEIPVDPGTGFVTSVSAAGPVQLAGGIDLEGVAYDSRTGEVLVSDEVGPAVRIHDPQDGVELEGVPLPAVFGQIRTNFGLESLTLGPRKPVGRSLWTANEEALLVDGPLSSFEQGTLVRLQRFDESALAPESWVPAAQWAYRTDPIGGGPAAGLERSGVVELVHLPASGVLVLERSFAAGGFRTRIYAVDVTAATETSAIGSFEETPVTPVAKTLLYEAGGLFENFEGIALGPRLANGDFSLLLVSDDGGVFGRSLQALRLQLAPEPAGGPAALALAIWLAARRAGARAATSSTPVRGSACAPRPCARRGSPR
jgi:hypothetical protein